MKILSFDVGIINLAYCIFESQTKLLTNWGIIDLKVSDFTATVPSGKASIAKAANDIHITLIKCLDSLPFLLEVDYVVVEKQPSFNPKMRIIGGCLQSYFYIRGIIDKPLNKISSIEFFSPKHKLKCYTGPELKLESKAKSKYAQTKKMGILIARAKLEEFDETEEFKTQFETSKKKDDLADCYLQAITFCLFKKFVKNESCIKIEPSKSLKLLKSLTKPQIKKQLKEYLDPLIKKMTVSELLQNPENGFKQVLENTPQELKRNIFTKYNLSSFEELTFLNDLSMKSYTKYHYLCN
jgi:hypothetical protein